MQNRFSLAKSSVGGFTLSLLMSGFLFIFASSSAISKNGNQNIPWHQQDAPTSPFGGSATDSTEVSLVVPENAEPGSVIGTLNQHLPFLHDTSGLRFQIYNLGPSADPEPQQLYHQTNDSESLFRIDPQTSIIRLADDAQLDRESICPMATGTEECCLTYGVLVTRVDKTAAPLTPQHSWSRLRIVILDVNDNEPRFNVDVSRRCETIHLSEDTAVGTKVRLPNAVDRDSLKNGQPIYRLQCQNVPTDHPFALYQKRSLISDEPTQIWLHVRYPLDYEKKPFYNCTLTACDSGTPILCSSLSLCIALHDVNDNSPVFLHENISTIQREDTPVGSRVTTVNATDADSGSFGEIRYSIITEFSDSQRTQRYFRVDPLTGEVILMSPLQGGSKFHFWVEARDGGEPESRMSRTALAIYVVDVNNHAPEIIILPAASKIRGKEMASATKSALSRVTKVPCNFGGLQDASVCRSRGKEDQEMSSLVQIFEDNVAPTSIALVRVSDDDVGANAQVNCQLVDTTAPFAGNIQLAAEHQISSRKMMYKLVLDTVLDCESHTYSKGLSICNSAWTIPIKIACHDFGNPMRKSYHNVFIEVLDVNEYPPVFEKNVYRGVLKENVPVGSNVVQVSVSDADALSTETSMIADKLHFPARPRYEERTLRFELDSLEKLPFAIDPLSGRIYTTGDLDAETITQYDFKVKAINTGLDNVTLASTCRVHVEVENVNDNPPQFLAPRMLVGSVVSHSSAVKNGSPYGEGVDGSQFLVQIPENLHRGTVFMQLMTHDPDGDAGRTNFHLQSCNPQRKMGRQTPERKEVKRNLNLPVFDVDANTGKCWTTGKLDRETVAAFVCVITAEDGNEASGERLTSTMTMAIALQDENDNAPVWLYPRAPDDSRIQIGVEFPPERIITRVRAVDADAGENAQVSYALEEVSFVHHNHHPTASATSSACSDLKRLFSVEKGFGHLRMHQGVRRCVQPGDSMRLLLKATDNSIESPLSKEAEFYVEFKAGSEVHNLPHQSATFLTQADEAFGSNAALSQSTLLFDAALRDSRLSPSNAAHQEAVADDISDAGGDAKRISVFVLMIAVPLCAILLCCCLVTTLLFLLRSRRRRRRATGTGRNNKDPHLADVEMLDIETSTTENLKHARYGYQSPKCPGPTQMLYETRSVIPCVSQQSVSGADSDGEPVAVSLPTGEVVYPVYLKPLPVTTTSAFPVVTGVPGESVVHLKRIPEVPGTFLVPLPPETNLIPCSSSSSSPLPQCTTESPGKYQSMQTDSGILMACLVSEADSSVSQ